MASVTSFDNTDKRANNYALRCFCITMLAFAVAWVMNQLNIFIVDKGIMNQGFCAALLLTVVCLLVCKFSGLEKPYVKYVLLFFIIAITTVIGMMLTYHAVLLSVLPIIYAAMYTETKKVTFYSWALTMVSIVIIVFGGYRIGLCDANMALLTSMPLADYSADGGIFTLNRINENPVATLSLFFVFPRCVLCSVFVPVVMNISTIIADSRMKEEEMRVLAEIDGMTGLYNKSKYLEQVSNPYTNEERLAVIYWDVNGLKQINDTLGHESGDKLILLVSDSIKQLATANEKAYRVGGDEFVMILRGADEKVVQKKIQQWKDSMKGLTVGSNQQVTAAVGYACGTGAELEQLIKTADEMMYENKREFHRHEAEER